MPSCWQSHRRSKQIKRQLRRKVTRMKKKPKLFRNYHKKLKHLKVNKNLWKKLQKKNREENEVKFIKQKEKQAFPHGVSEQVT